MRATVTAATKSDRKFVYVTYIAAAPEKVFEALTEGAITSQYWFGATIKSDWKVGSLMEMHGAGGKLDFSGEVLAYDPPTGLSYHFDQGGESTRVVFTLEEKDHQTKLTVEHDEFDEGSKMLQGITNGWPMVLSALKTLLECGKLMTQEPTCGKKQA